MHWTIRSIFRCIKKWVCKRFYRPHRDFDAELWKLEPEYYCPLDAYPTPLTPNGFKTLTHL